VGALTGPARTLAVLVALFLCGCGPAIEVPTTPTPAPVGSPGASTHGGQSTPIASGPADGPTSSAIPPTDGTQTSAPTTPPTPFTGPVWTKLTEFPASEAFEATSVVVLAGGGFKAVGFRAMLNEGFFGRRQGVVWTSADGLTWQVAIDPAFQYTTLEHIAQVGSTLYVFGTIATCDLSLSEDCVEPPDSGWALWSSTDGSPWTRLPLPASMQGGTIDGVVPAPAGIIAFGWTGDEAQSMLWASADGTNWTETADLAEMDPVTAMTFGPNALVAFGTRFSQELGDLELIAAASSDGAHFGRTTAPSLVATSIESVVAGPAGLVAVGNGGDEDLNFTGVTMQSPDGLTWTQGSATDGSFAGVALQDVHVVPNGYVALGFVPDIAEFGVATGGSWFSSDGLSWASTAELGEQFSQLDASAVSQSGIVAFTVTEEQPDDETVVSTVSAWFAPIEAFSGE
jgi:hypothetical protein